MTKQMAPRAALCLGILVVVARVATADVAPKWTDAQLVGFSEVIVRGRVTSVRVARDDRVRAPYTYVALNVAEVLKGDAPDRRIVLKQLGGRIGSTALQIAGQPTFAVGDDVFVFLEVRPRDRTLTTTAQWQGKFNILPDGSGHAVATRHDPQLPARGCSAMTCAPPRHGSVNCVA